MFLATFFGKRLKFSRRNMTYLYISRTISKLNHRRARFECCGSSLLSPPHHSFCFYLSVWMAAARGRQYLEETRLRQIEGIRLRTEERTVQSPAEANRIGDESSRLRAHPKGSREATDSPSSAFRFCVCFFFFSSLPFHSLLLLCLYVVHSWPHAPPN